MKNINFVYEIYPPIKGIEDKISLNRYIKTVDYKLDAVKNKYWGVNYKNLMNYLNEDFQKSKTHKNITALQVIFTVKKDLVYIFDLEKNYHNKDLEFDNWLNYIKKEINFYYEDQTLALDISNFEESSVEGCTDLCGFQVGRDMNLVIRENNKLW
jgi:hypothetical protein